MLSHAIIAVDNYAQSLIFYDQAFKVLGYKRLLTIDNDYAKCVGYGLNATPEFWLSPRHFPGNHVRTASNATFVFVASCRSDVDRWFDLCLELGGTSVTKPAARAHFHPGYYSASVFDPNGWQLEVCHYDAVATSAGR